MRDDRTFIRVHDGMPDHPKIEPLSDAAFRLLVTCWCYCSRNLTDGHMSATAWGKRGTAKARKELIAAGLAVKNGDAVVLHDYLDHQRSAAEAAAKKEQARAAGRAGGLAKGKRLAKRTASETLSEPLDADRPESAEKSKTFDENSSTTTSSIGASKRGGPNGIPAGQRAAAGSEPLSGPLSERSSGIQAEVEVEVEKDSSTHLSSDAGSRATRAKMQRRDPLARTRASDYLDDRPLQDTAAARELLDRVIASNRYDAYRIDAALDSLARQGLPVTAATMRIELDGPSRPDSAARQRDGTHTVKASEWLELAHNAAAPPLRAVEGGTA